MVTTLSSGQMVMLVAALVVAVLLAPALVYAHTWLRAVKRRRAQQARKSRRRLLTAGRPFGRQPGSRTWPDRRARPGARVTDSR